MKSILKIILLLCGICTCIIMSSCNANSDSERIQLGDVTFLPPEDCGEYYESYTGEELTWTAFQDGHTAISVAFSLIDEPFYTNNIQEEYYYLNSSDATEIIQVKGVEVRLNTYYTEDGNIRTKTAGFIYEDRLYYLDAGTWKTEYIETALEGFERILDTLELK